MTRQPWRVLLSRTTNPALNLAIEEALLRRRIDADAPNTLRIWRNQPCVVIGHSQDVEAEVNLPWCRVHNVPILRRCSGGGAVYHDLGNFNYSVITTRQELPQQRKSMSHFRFICRGLMQAISSLGGSPRFVPPSSIFVDGGKVSGSAQYLLYDGVLQHGTLLVSTNLAAARAALQPNAPTATQFSRVRSTPAPMRNLGDILRQALPARLICTALIDAFTALFRVPWVIGTLTAAERQLAQWLIRLKYSDSDWTMNPKAVTLAQRRLPSGYQSCQS